MINYLKIQNNDQNIYKLKDANALPIRYASTSTLGGIQGSMLYKYDGSKPMIDPTRTENKDYQVNVGGNGIPYVNIPWIEYGIASNSGIGKIRVVNTPASNTIISSYTTTVSNRYYFVQTATDGTAFVNVPWESDLVKWEELLSTVILYGAKLVYYNGTNLVPTTYDVRYASTDIPGRIKTWFSISNNENFTNDVICKNDSTPNRYYGLQADGYNNVNNSNLPPNHSFVNVPWTNTYTEYTIGVGLTSTDKQDLFIHGSFVYNKSFGKNLFCNLKTYDYVNATSTPTGASTNKLYSVQKDKNGNLGVQVSWTNTTYDIGSPCGPGLAVIGYQDNDTTKKYGVKLDSNSKAYISVPWPDENAYDDTEFKADINVQINKINSLIGKYTLGLPNISLLT